MLAVFKRIVCNLSTLNKSKVKLNKLNMQFSTGGTRSVEKFLMFLPSFITNGFISVSVVNKHNFD